MVSIFCALALSALIIGLSRCTVELSADICGDFPLIKVCVRILGVRVSRTVLRPVFGGGRGIRLFSIKHGHCALVKRKLKKEKNPLKIMQDAVLSGIRLEAALIRGRVGIAGDAALTSLLCGAINAVAAAALAPITKGSPKTDVAPDFCQGCFWLKLQGILHVNVWHISFELIKLKGRKKYGK